MISSKAKIKTFILSTLVLGVVITGGIVTLEKTGNANLFNKKTDANFNKNTGLFASLSGFAPNATVNYKISGKGELPLTGVAQTDQNGDLHIPMPEQFNQLQHDITYNFMIDEADKTLNVVLKHDPLTGRMNIFGQGADEFTKIVIESGDETFETKSDWAGEFEEKNIKNIWSAKNAKPYKIAFYSTDPARDLYELTRAPIINIQWAPGGGFLDDPNINSNFQTTQCDSNPILGYCNVAKMKEVSQRFTEAFIPPFQMMAEQLSTTATHQMQIIATFFDAKEQLEVQRDIQERVAEAHKDYHPSKNLCQFGSFSRSISSAENKSEANTLSFNKIMMDYYNNTQGNASAMGRGQAFETRVHQFRTVYCDLSDNNASLKYMCEHDQSGDGTPPTGAKDWKRVNKDIDFQRTLDSVNTIEVNYADSKATDIEEDIVALAKNLYWPVTYERPDPDTLPQHKYDIMDARRVTALYSIAHNSFAHYVGLKSEANSAPKKDKFVPGWAYMNTMLREFNISDEEITNIMGENPSYYAQMDFLTKKLYQIPDFYTNLYDTPTNVDRILVSMDAISLMQQRDHYESMLRHEMLSSALLQTELVPRMERVQALLGQTVE